MLLVGQSPQQEPTFDVVHSKWAAAGTCVNTIVRVQQRTVVENAAWCTTFAQAHSDAHVAMQIRKGPDEEWRDLHIPNSVRAIIMINLQTYMGGCDLWGMHEHHMPEEQAKNLKKPIFDDGLIEVILSHLGFLHCSFLCWQCLVTAWWHYVIAW